MNELLVAAKKSNENEIFNYSILLFGASMMALSFVGFLT